MTTMINLLFLSILILAKSSFAYSCPKVTVSEIVNRHIDATGGRLVLSSLKSIQRVGKILFFQDPSKPPAEYSYRTDLIYPRELRERLIGSDILVDRGTDGTQFWEWRDRKYQLVESTALVNQMKETAERANRDILYLMDEFQSFEVADETPSWTQNDICIKGAKNGIFSFICFDQSTGLLSAKGTNEEYRLF